MKSYMLFFLHMHLALNMKYSVCVDILNHFFLGILGPGVAIVTDLKEQSYYFEPCFKIGRLFL